MVNLCHGVLCFDSGFQFHSYQLSVLSSLPCGLLNTAYLLFSLVCFCSRLKRYGKHLSHLFSHMSILL